MSDIEKIEKRLIKLESRYLRFVDDTNKMAANIASVVEGIDKRLGKNEKKTANFYRDQVRINNTAYRHVTTLEKRFGKMDKHAKKMKKHTEPRMMEKNTMKLVDQALKAYDQKKGKR